MAARALVIQPDGTTSVETVTGLNDLYRIIDCGFVEGQTASYGGSPIQVYCDEQGKIKNLPVNPLASKFGWLTGALPKDDQYAGTVMVLGVHLVSGIEKDAPEDLIKLMIRVPLPGMHKAQFARAITPDISALAEEFATWTKANPTVVDWRVEQAWSALQKAQALMRGLALEWKPFEPRPDDTES